jgi:hypothetical protein
VLPQTRAVREGRRLLNSILSYVYDEAQQAATAFERDGYTLALAVIGAVRSDSKNPFTEACYLAFGSSWERYIERRNEWYQLHAGEMRIVASQRAQAELDALTAWQRGMGLPHQPQPEPAEISAEATHQPPVDLRGGKRRKPAHTSLPAAPSQSAARPSGRPAANG